jgi:uncharacterized integral membrane protein
MQSAQHSRDMSTRRDPTASNIENLVLQIVSFATCLYTFVAILEHKAQPWFLAGRTIHIFFILISITFTTIVILNKEETQRSYNPSVSALSFALAIVGVFLMGMLLFSKMGKEIEWWVEITVATLHAAWVWRTFSSILPIGEAYTAKRTSI